MLTSRVSWVCLSKSKSHIINSEMLKHLACGSDSAVPYMINHKWGNHNTLGKSAYKILFIILLILLYYLVKWWKHINIVNPTIVPTLTVDLQNILCYYPFWDADCWVMTHGCDIEVAFHFQQSSISIKLFWNINHTFLFSLHVLRMKLYQFFWETVLQHAQLSATIVRTC